MDRERFFKICSEIFVVYRHLADFSVKDEKNTRNHGVGRYAYFIYSEMGYRFLQFCLKHGIENCFFGSKIGPGFEGFGGSHHPKYRYVPLPRI